MVPNTLKCAICCNIFSNDQCPRILPCSHSLCTPCIQEMILRKDKLACTSCGETFTAATAEDLTLNRGLLEAAKELSSIHIGTTSSTTAPARPKSPLEEITNDFRKKFTQRGIKEWQEIILQTFNHIETLNAMKDEIFENVEEVERCSEILKDFKRSNLKIMGTLTQNIQLMTDNLNTMQQEEHKIKGFDERVAQAKDYSAAGNAMEEARTFFDTFQEKATKFRYLLKTNERERQDVQKKLLELTTNLADTAEMIHKRTQHRIPTEDITVDDLRSLLGSLTKEVFARKVVHGREMIAPVITESEHEVSLCRLRENTLPPNSLVLEYDTLMKSSSRRVFLDLALDETFIGRLIIRVADTGNLAKFFLHLCKGDLGLSYANSQVREVGNQRFGLGKYMKRERIAWEAVLSAVDWQAEWKSSGNSTTACGVGVVMGYESKNFVPEFFIITEQQQHNRVLQNNQGGKKYIGNVVKGMDALNDTISMYHARDLERITVADCGMILSL